MHKRDHPTDQHEDILGRLAGIIGRMDDTDKRLKNPTLPIYYWHGLGFPDEAVEGQACITKDGGHWIFLNGAWREKGGISYLYARRSADLSVPDSIETHIGFDTIFTTNKYHFLPESADGNTWEATHSTPIDSFFTYAPGIYFATISNLWETGSIYRRAVYFTSASSLSEWAPLIFSYDNADSRFEGIANDPFHGGISGTGSTKKWMICEGGATNRVLPALIQYSGSSKRVTGVGIGIGPILTIVRLGNPYPYAPDRQSIHGIENLNGDEFHAQINI